MLSRENYYPGTWGKNNQVFLDCFLQALQFLLVSSIFNYIFPYIMCTNIWFMFIGIINWATGLINYGVSWFQWYWSEHSDRWNKERRLYIISYGISRISFEPDIKLVPRQWFRFTVYFIMILNFATIAVWPVPNHIHIFTEKMYYMFCVYTRLQILKFLRVSYYNEPYSHFLFSKNVFKSGL